jgi:hypothetical protein
MADTESLLHSDYQELAPAEERQSALQSTSPFTSAQPRSNPLFSGEYVEGEPRLLGLRIRRRAVWAFFFAASLLVLVLSCVGDSVIKQHDGVIYLHYSHTGAGDDYTQADALSVTPDLPPRSGFRCTSGGGKAAESAVVLSVVPLLFCLSALFLGTYITCRCGCTIRGPPLATCGAERGVYTAQNASWALMIICANLWLSRLILIATIRGACGLEFKRRDYYYGAAKTYAERGWELRGRTVWTGNVNMGVVEGSLHDPPGFYVRYDQNSNLQTYTRRPAGQSNLYGLGIAAGVLGFFATLLQIPAVLYSERCIRAKQARMSAEIFAGSEMAVTTPPPNQQFANL